MKTSKILKLTIAFSIALIALLILNIHSVNAADLTTENLQEVLDSVPATLDTNLKESEYQQVKTLIKDIINPTLKEKGINADTIDLQIEASPIYLSASDFYTAEIYIGLKNNYSVSASKKINLTFSNTDKYNKNDESAVKSLNIEAPKYYVLDYKELLSGDRHNKFLDFIGTYHTKQCNDKSIKITAFSGAGGGSPFEYGYHGVTLAIFKNDILYETRGISSKNIIVQLTIPSSIEDTEDASVTYATSEIEKVLKNDGYTGSITLEKGDNYDDGVNVEENNTYTIKDSNDILGVIILKREVVDVKQEDTDTGITLDTASDVVPSDTKIVAESIKSGSSYNTVVSVLNEYNKIEVFDLSLVSNNQKVQPNGKVKISIPVPDEMDASKIEVYRVDDDGTKTKYNCKIETINNKKYITFETNHFSLYVLAQKTETSNITEASTQNNDSTEVEQTSTSTEKKNDNKGKLDETPKTGSVQTVSIVSIIAVLSVLSLIIIKKK